MKGNVAYQIRQRAALQRRENELEVWKDRLQKRPTEKETIETKIKICKTDIENLKKKL